MNYECFVKVKTTHCFVPGWSSKVFWHPMAARMIFKSKKTLFWFIPIKKDMFWLDNNYTCFQVLNKYSPIMYKLYIISLVSSSGALAYQYDVRDDIWKYPNILCCNSEQSYFRNNLLSLIFKWFPLFFHKLLHKTAKIYHHIFLNI